MIRNANAVGRAAGGTIDERESIVIRRSQKGMLSAQGAI